MAHHNYYLDLCAETYIVHNESVLLRFHEKIKTWMGPGGHIDPGEDANQAAIRECWEEVGLNVTLIGPAHWEHAPTHDNQDLVPPLFINRHSITEEHEHSCFIFAGTCDSADINPQTNEDKRSAAKCIWVTQAELDAMHENDPDLRPEMYRYATAALALVAARRG